MMKSPIMALVIMISILLIASPSSGRLLMKNTLFTSGPDNPSVFDPNLNSFINGDSTVHTPYGHVEKDTVECDQEISPLRISSAKSATNEKTQSPVKFEGVFNLLPKGSVTPSGPSPKVNSMVIEQRLSTSGKRPGAGHMQMIRPESQRLNGDILESHHSHGDDHVQQEKKDKRKLRSTPSPGGGH